MSVDNVLKTAGDGRLNVYNDTQTTAVLGINGDKDAGRCLRYLRSSSGLRGGMLCGHVLPVSFILPGLHGSSFKSGFFLVMPGCSLSKRSLKRR